MYNIDINPATKGQTRSTWRDTTHLRGLLMELIRLHPDAERDELENLYLDKAKQEESLIDEAVFRAFDNDFALLHRPPPRLRQWTKPSRTDVAAAAEKLREIVLLDFVLPNGKKLRDCTGKECREAGGWLTKVGARVGDRRIVGTKLSEAEVAKMFKAGLKEARS